MSAHNTVQKIEHNGVVVAERGEMMSLTDMWKASGSDQARKPAEWLRSEGASRFIEFLAQSVDVAEVGNSHFGLVKVSKGGATRGVTFAHWQIGLAYAKYLDPAFHMKCNQIVRERMEGKSVSVASLPPDVVEMIRRDDGISRQLSGKVKRMEETLAAIIEIVRPSTPVRYRHGKTAGEIWDRYNLPKLKNAPTWLGNRLAEMGCMADRFDLGRKAIRLFDPDRAEVVMKNGLLHRTRQYISERQGQGRLRLIGEAI